MRQLMGGAFVAAALACALAACGGGSKTAALPKTAPSAPPAAARRRIHSRPRRPRTRLRERARGAAASGVAAPAAAEAGAAGGRGGRGNTPPLPPPPKPLSPMPAPVKPIVSAIAPSPDPRVGLSPGLWTAGQAAWNMRMISTTPPTEKSLGLNAKGEPIHWGDPDSRIPTHSDLAFFGSYAVEGNYNGFEIWTSRIPPSPSSRRPNRPASRTTVDQESDRDRRINISRTDWPSAAPIRWSATAPRRSLFDIAICRR
jgi:hypothetical protein